MWTYICRRLLVMIPTLFGVTVVSFVIMQLAPGDPLLSTAGAGGTAGETSQTRESYLIRKRDLKLDKPLLINIRYFWDYAEAVEMAAHFRVMSSEQIADEVAELAKDSSSPESAARLRFLRSLRVPNFKKQFQPPQLTPEQLDSSNLTAEQREKEVRQIRLGLARAVQKYVQVWCEDIGVHGVPPAVAILETDDSTRLEKIGAIRCLAPMVVSPFSYTFSRDPTPQERERVVTTWQRLWAEAKDRYPALDPDRGEVLKKKLQELAAATRTEMFKKLQGSELFADDAPFFADVLFGESTLDEQAVAAEFLRLNISKRLSETVATDADLEQIGQVSQNWISYYESAHSQFHPGFLSKVAYIFADTQYGHMIWRLATFNFGRSAAKTREPVSEKILNAVIVSAPLMIMAQLVIYFLAVPLGIICSVNRGKWLDRLISLALFFLYSIPPFVAAMMFLLFFCFGGYLKWFPMERLHSPGADQFGFLQYGFDYFWHATLPVICLSLFSLAGLAMYSRTSMLDVLGQDYIRTARAKGVSQGKVILKHALRNGLIPIITLFANFLPAMLGGSVLIEYLFNIPGMGRLSFSSILEKDIPTLMALIYIDAIVVMLSILMTDILYVFVDPRISFESQGKTS